MNVATMPPDSSTVTHGDLREALTPIAAGIGEIKAALLGTTTDSERGLLHRVATLEAEAKRRGQILAAIGVVILGLLARDGYAMFMRAAQQPQAATYTTTTTTNNAAPAVAIQPPPATPGAATVRDVGPGTR